MTAGDPFCEIHGAIKCRCNMNVNINGKAYVPAMNIAINDAPSLGELLKKGRQNCDLTLQQAADYVGTSKSYVHELENNKSEPGLWLAGRLAELYGIDLRVMAKVKRA